MFWKRFKIGCDVGLFAGWLAEYWIRNESSNKAIKDRMLQLQRRPLSSLWLKFLFPLFVRLFGPEFFEKRQSSVTSARRKKETHD